LVISHDCEIDKARNAERVLMAPLQPLSTLEPEMRQIVLEQKLLALMPLPDMGSFGDQFADLRLLDAIPRDLVADTARVVSMTEFGRDRLHAQLSKFLLRREPPAAAADE
jgi:hypothetical protein